MTSDPVRWLESSEPSELLLLMRVGAEELAPPDALARVEQRMRVPGPAHAESSAPPSASPHVSPTPGSAGSTGGLVVKALGLSLLLGAAGLSLYQLVRPVAPASAPVPGGALRVQAPAPPLDVLRTPPAPASVRAETNAPPLPSLDGAPREQAPHERTEPAAHPRRSRVRTQAQPSEPKLQPVDARLEEARLLEQARRELSVQPDRALALLREHAKRFPQSWLEEEREAMLIRALEQTGQSAAARVQLERFKARFPRSVHSQRLERALAPR